MSEGLDEGRSTMVGNKAASPLNRRGNGASQVRGPVAPGVVSPSSAVTPPPGINVKLHEQLNPGVADTVGGRGSTHRGSTTAKAKTKVASRTIRAPPLDGPGGMLPGADAGFPAAAAAAANAAFAALASGRSPLANGALGPSVGSPAAASAAAFMQHLQAYAAMSSQYRMMAFAQIQEVFRLRMLEQMQLMSHMQQIQAIQEMEAMWEMMEAQSSSSSGGFWDPWVFGEDGMQDGDRKSVPHVDPSSMTAEEIEEKIQQAIQAAQDRLKSEHIASIDEVIEAPHSQPAPARTVFTDDRSLEARIQETLQQAALRRSSEAPRAVDAADVDAKVAVALAAAKHRNGNVAPKDGQSRRPGAKTSSTPPPVATPHDIQARIDEAMRAARERKGQSAE